MAKEIRDAEGNLAAYDLDAQGRIVLERMLAEQKEHINRIDSNISDLKYGQATQASKIDKLFAKLSETLLKFHETLEIVSKLSVENVALSTVCAEYTTAKIAREANWKLIKRVGAISGAIITGASAIIGAVLKVLHKI